MTPRIDSAEDQRYATGQDLSTATGTQIFGLVTARFGIRVANFGDRIVANRHTAAEYGRMQDDGQTTRRFSRHQDDNRRTNRRHGNTGRTSQFDEIDINELLDRFAGTPNPWGPDARRPQLPNTGASGKGDYSMMMSPDTETLLMQKCPWAAVALQDWIVLHASSDFSAQARRNLTRLLQLVNPSKSAIDNAKLGVIDARVQNEGQLTASLDLCGIRYLELRGSDRFADLLMLAKHVSKLIEALDEGQHTGRQSSACVLQATILCALGEIAESHKVMARAMVLFGLEYQNVEFENIARTVNADIATETIDTVAGYPGANSTNRS